MAAGYSGLQLTTQIMQTDRYEICWWNYEGVFQVNIISIALPCQNRTESWLNLSLFCEEENNRITASLIIHFPIESPVLVGVQCAVLVGDLSQELSSINISVKGKRTMFYN